MSEQGGKYKSWRARLPNIYTVSDTAAILGVSQKLVLEWIEQEALPAIRLGLGQRALRVRLEDLQWFIKNRFEPSVPPGHGGSLRPEPQEGDEE